MEWRPFGSESTARVLAFKKGCAGGGCVHININMAMSPKEAIHLSDTIIKAVKYTKKGVEWA
jgi:hypothetical protein